jgi:hypothetical protein
MPIDPEKLADEFVATINAALTPLRAQLREQAAAHAADHDRLVMLETELRLLREWCDLKPVRDPR